MYQHRPESDAVLDELPEICRRGVGKFREAWTRARLAGFDPDVMRDALKRYYASPEGKTRYRRDPANFIDQEGWREPEAAWQRGQATDESKPPRRGHLDRLIENGHLDDE